jgi:hypothetical protein
VKISSKECSKTINQIIIIIIGEEVRHGNQEQVRKQGAH